MKRVLYLFISGNATSETTVQTCLYPYTRIIEIFLQPETHRPYLPNYKISRKDVAQITSPYSTILFYEDAPSSDGKRAVAYLDGHVARIEEDEFQRQREAQGISASGFPSAMKPARKP